MKRKFLFASLILMGASLVANAQGYKDGIEYYKVDKLDNAKELLERNLNAASTDKAEAFYYLGQIALHQGQVAQAAANFEKGIAANAMNPYNYVGQAAIALKNGGDVKTLLEKARKLSKKDSKLEMEIARAFYDANPTTYAKDIEKCIKNARKWNADDPDSYIFEADTKADKKDWGNAAGIYELAFDKDPNNIEAYVKYANTYFNVNPAMAIERLEELQAKVPGSALVQRELAEKYYADNLGAKAAEQYGKYIKNPNHFAQDEVRYVQLLFFGEKYQDSYNLATQLINRLNPNDENVFYMKRMQLYNLVQLEKWPEAVEAGKAFFANMLPKGSKYEVRDYTDYGQALLTAGMPNEAVAAFEKALEINPNNVDLIRYMGDSYADAEDFVNAAKYYQRLVDSGNNKSNDLFTLLMTPPRPMLLPSLRSMSTKLTSWFPATCRSLTRRPRSPSSARVTPTRAQLWQLTTSCSRSSTRRRTRPTMHATTSMPTTTWPPTTSPRVTRLLQRATTRSGWNMIPRMSHCATTSTA